MLYGLGRRMLALPLPGLRGLLLGIGPGKFYPALVFALALLIMVWKPALGPRLWCCAFATPLISHFARRAFGTSGPKQPGNWLEAGCIQFSNLDWR